MRVRAAHDVEVQHARELHVVDEIPAAADEPGVFLALDRVADATQLYRTHYALPAMAGSAGVLALLASRIAALACWIDFTMFT